MCVCVCARGVCPDVSVCIVCLCDVGVVLMCGRRVRTDYACVVCVCVWVYGD